MVPDGKPLSSVPRIVHQEAREKLDRVIRDLNLMSEALYSLRRTVSILAEAVSSFGLEICADSTGPGVRPPQPDCPVSDADAGTGPRPPDLRKERGNHKGCMYGDTCDLSFSCDGGDILSPCRPHEVLTVCERFTPIPSGKGGD